MPVSSATIAAAASRAIWQIAFVRVGQVIYNCERMRQVIDRSEHIADSVPVPLETPVWDSLWRRPLIPLPDRAAAEIHA